MKQQELIKKLEKELFNRDILKSNSVIGIIFSYSFVIHWTAFI